MNDFQGETRNPEESTLSYKLVAAEIPLSWIYFYLYLAILLEITVIISQP